MYTIYKFYTNKILVDIGITELPIDIFLKKETRKNRVWRILTPNTEIEIAQAKTEEEARKYESFLTKKLKPVHYSYDLLTPIPKNMPELEFVKYEDKELNKWRRKENRNELYRKVKELIDNGKEKNLEESIMVIMNEVCPGSECAEYGFLKKAAEKSREELYQLKELVCQKQEIYNSIHEERLIKIKNDFITGVRNAVKKGRLPISALSNLARLVDITIKIDAGFETYIDGSMGSIYYEMNTILIDAKVYSSEAEVTAYHELMHAIAGGIVRTMEDSGLIRLYKYAEDYHYETYDGYDEKKELDRVIYLLNECFVNSQAILLHKEMCPETLSAKHKEELNRSLKAENYIGRIGTKAIPKKYIQNAYFSNDVKDVIAFVTAIEIAFSSRSVFCQIADLVNYFTEETGDNDG